MSPPASAPVATTVPTAPVPAPEHDAHAAGEAIAQKLRGCRLQCRLLAGAISVLCLSASGGPVLVATAAATLAAAATASPPASGAQAMQTLAALAAIVAVTAGWPDVGGSTPARRRRSSAPPPPSCISRRGEADPV